MNAHKELQTGVISGVFDQKLMILDFNVLILNIEKSMIIAEIFQNLLLSLILYLFYIIKLLNICNNNNKKFSTNIFINDIILLTYEFFIKINYYMLT